MTGESLWLLTLHPGTLYVINENVFVQPIVWPQCSVCSFCIPGFYWLLNFFFADRNTTYLLAARTALACRRQRDIGCFKCFRCQCVFSTSFYHYIKLFLIDRLSCLEDSITNQSCFHLSPTYSKLLKHTPRVCLEGKLFPRKRFPPCFPCMHTVVAARSCQSSNLVFVQIPKISCISSLLHSILHLLCSERNYKCCFLNDSKWWVLCALHFPLWVSTPWRLLHLKGICWIRLSFSSLEVYWHSSATSLHQSLQDALYCKDQNN